MKKFLSIALVLAMMFALAIPVMAIVDSGNSAVNQNGVDSKVLGNSSTFYVEDKYSVTIKSDNKQGWIITNDSDVDVKVEIRVQVSNKYSTKTITVKSGETVNFDNNKGKDSVNNVWFMGGKHICQEGDKEIITFPTCTEKGKWEIRCTICDEIMKSRNIRALGHKMGNWIKGETLETCVTNEHDTKWTETRSCTREECDHYKSRTKTAICNCTVTLPCEHPNVVCDNCKNGDGNNHDNCWDHGNDLNENKTTNYFCSDCGVKVGSHNYNDVGRLICSCK